MGPKLSPKEADALLERCFAAYDDAARAQFKKDGSQDCGSCGGAMLSYPTKSPLGQALIRSGDYSGGSEHDPEVFVSRRLPQDVRTQHDEVEIKAIDAFMATAREAGVEPKRHWTYVD